MMDDKIIFHHDDFKKSLMGVMGASESVADNFNAFIRAMNAGRIFSARRNAESTTPASIEDFAATFAYVYNLK